MKFCPFVLDPADLRIPTWNLRDLCVFFLDCLFKMVFLPHEHQWQVLLLETVMYLDNEMFPLITFDVSCHFIVDLNAIS